MRCHRITFVYTPYLRRPYVGLPYYPLAHHPHHLHQLLPTLSHSHPFPP